MIDHSGMALQEAIAILRQYLPKYAILVGQNIGKDVEWLGLKEGVDFQVRCHFPLITQAFLVCRTSLFTEQCRRVDPHVTGLCFHREWWIYRGYTGYGTQNSDPSRYDCTCCFIVFMRSLRIYLHL